jgi:D-alanyl-D-alanine carboxypeptidase
MMNMQAVASQLGEFVAQKMQADGTPGLALALTDRERLLHVATYGYADIAARTPVTPDTLFEIGSIGKSFTSIALLQQREAGRLDLHQPVTRYLPWFQIRSPYAPIALHHLMSHTAGIANGTDLAPCTRYEVVSLQEMETASPPGAHFHYSNVGYKALGYLLEDLLGQPYGAILRSDILDPLDMAATHAVITFETRKHMALGHRRFYDDRPAHHSHPLVPAAWHEYGAGDGSPASTPADMAAYVRMLLNRGRGPRGRILSEESFALMTQHVIEAWGSAHYGYGLMMSEVDGHTYVGHGGGTLGYLSTILADMDDGFGAAVLINGPGEPFEIATYALRLLRASTHDQELPALPPPKAPTQIEQAADYAGTYLCGAKTLNLVDQDGRLILNYGDEQIILEQRDPDTFRIPHADFTLFLLRFGRQEGRVVEACYGADWYAGERYAGPTSFDSPSEWAAYPGHYRSHNPWLSNFRVVMRKGALMLIFPGGGEEPLAPLDDGTFRVGGEEHSPERIRFGAVVEGQALRANLSECDYYRFFTP